jgi:hypothetical protein
MSVVDRADSISREFFKAFKAKLAGKRHSDLPLEALADFAWLMIHHAHRNSCHLCHVFLSALVANGQGPRSGRRLCIGEKSSLDVRVPWDYGSLTDDYRYHPNIVNMHMKTHVDDDQRQVVFLYKLIPGVAESSHGTRTDNRPSTIRNESG